MDVELTDKSDGRYAQVEEPPATMRGGSSSRRGGGGGGWAKCIPAAIVLAVVLVIVLLLSILIVSSNHNNDSSSSHSSSSSSVWDPDHTTSLSLEDCLAANVKDGLNDHTMTGLGDQRLSPDSPESVLLQHVHLVSHGEELDDVDVLITGTKIAQVSEPGVRITAPSADTEVVDVEGRFVTPALVDMHSHLGVYAFPELEATQDGNEMTKPAFPQLRARDAFDPYDYAIPAVLAGGTVTAQVLPGSGDVQGGQAFLVKLRGHTVASMLIPNAPNPLKMALGQNPKRVFGTRNPPQTPMSRLGIAWVLRSQFETARNMKNRQDAWCKSSSPAHAFPNDLSIAPLVRLLRNSTTTRLNVHAYKVLDFEMLLSISREFGFNVTAFHHALEAWRVPELIKEHGITVATFSDLWGYKFEAYDASVRGPKILDEAGVNTVLKTDHPVTYAARLVEEPAKAFYYGLNRMTAYQASTRNAAVGIGMADRVGSIAPGMDADVVVWDRDPLVLGAKTTHVFANGELVHHVPRPLETHESSTTGPTATLAVSGISPCAGPSPTYALTGASVYTMTDGVKHDNWNIIVEFGKVVCVGPAATCNSPFGPDVYDLAGGVVTPGLTESLSYVGLTEIDDEWTTMDGQLDVTVSGDVAAMDGIRMDTRHVRSTYRAGVTASVSSPMGTDLIRGQSVAFFTLPPSNATTVRSPGIIIKPLTALHATAGNDAKNGGMTASISGQLALLRRTFSTNSSVPAEKDAIQKVLAGVLPLVVHVDQLDAIAAVVGLKDDFPTIRLVIAGAAEAHLMADELAAAGVGVVLKSRRMPSNFDTLRADDCALATLTAANVTTALAVGDLDNARNLRWEAWMGGVECGMSEYDALAAVTTKVADLFGLGTHGTIQVGAMANFVGFDGPPLTTLGRPQVVAVGEQVVCHPEQR